MNVFELDQVNPVRDSLRTFLADGFPDLQYQVDPLITGPPVEFPISIRLTSEDYQHLYDLRNGILDKMASIPGVGDVYDDWGPQGRKLTVQINRSNAKRAGVSNRDIAIALQTSLDGFFSTEFREGEDVIPVLLKAGNSDRWDIARLAAIPVRSTAFGPSVPLQQLASLKLDWQPTRIKRRDRQRVMTLSASLQPGMTAEEVASVMEPWLNQQKKNWPEGVGFQLGGSVEESEKANKSIFDKLPISMAIILILLVAQFNSLRHALIISMTIPLGLTGVIMGLLVTGSFFGFMTLLGIISLAGIVINNAIVLLDRIRIEREQLGRGFKEAILEASRQRLRPILLTTATTVGGLLPLWFGGGPMWEPMAIAIIFGLIFSTVLTLGFVPLAYAALYKPENQ